MVWSHRDRLVLVTAQTAAHPEAMTKSRLRWLLGSAVALVAIAWLGWLLFGPGTAPAGWKLAPGATVSEDSTTVEVLVSRMGCASGQTGEVLEPDVEMTADEVVVRFRVSPGEPAEASCPDNPEVAYTVTLDEPLGQRRLVDGECLESGAGVGTSNCREDRGIRYEPPTG